MGWLSKILRYVPAEERAGICLGQASAWEVSPVKDMAAFLRAIDTLVPPGSVLYLEGGSLTNDVRSYLDGRTPEKTTKVAMGTVWPRPKVVHMHIDRANLEGLAELAERHASPELAIHLHIYKEDDVLVEWYDAFSSDPFMVSKQIPEARLREFCNKLGVRYREVAGGDCAGRQSGVRGCCDPVGIDDPDLTGTIGPGR